MDISWITPFSLIEYPWKISCVIFTPGCNFRCGYCHNSEFVLPEKLEKLQKSFISEDVFFSFLEKRKGKIQWISICGGEPCIHKDLPSFCRKIKDKWFYIKLDTNGSFPDMLWKLLEQNLLDYIAMDIKSDITCYDVVAGTKISKKNILESIELIKCSWIEYEFRTTFIGSFHNEEMVVGIWKLVQGSQKYFLQNFRSRETLNPNFSWKPFSMNKLKKFKEILEKYVVSAEIRL